MSGIFNEKTMIQSLSQYLPEGETLTAGIHGIGVESEVRQLFRNCILVGEQLIPEENGAVLEISKSKYSNCDIYIGITQHYLLLSECDACQHLYEYNDHPDVRGDAVEEVHTTISIQEIGACFPLAEIQKCVIKKGWMGSVNCSITMKNGTFLKLMLPKLGGLGGGMPRHKEYREAIIARLSSCGA